MVATSIVRGAKVLVINSGSSSLKFKLFGQGQGSAASALGVLASGLVERIGDKESSMHYEVFVGQRSTLGAVATSKSFRFLPETMRTRAWSRRSWTARRRRGTRPSQTTRSR